MIPYTRKADAHLEGSKQKIACFYNDAADNIDEKTVASFGEEWSKFDQFTEEEIQAIGDEYFDIVPDHCFGEDKVALDVGCGSGRWSLYVADRVGFLEGIDPSNAVFVAENSTAKKGNVRITKAGVDQIPFADESFDFVFSLGVLHHIPNTAEAMRKSVAKVKKGGYFLVYLYYSLDNRGPLYKLIFNLSNSVRWLISRMPAKMKKFFCDIIAFLVYMPLVGLAATFKKLGLGVWKKIPLCYYVGKSIFVIRNDALDRFGTPLEQRFSRAQIKQMMEAAGLSDIIFSENQPYWHALGRKQA